MKKKIIAVMLMLAVVAAACACGNKENGDVPVTAWNTATQSPAPVVESTAEPTAAPTAEPTTESTAAPTAEPTTEPAAAPTAEPTTEPTAAPTAEPTAEPTAAPTAVPTTEPTAVPTAAPTVAPTAAPTTAPTAQKASASDVIPGTSVTQQYIDDICNHYGSSIAVVNAGDGQMVLLCASWCRSNFVGQRFTATEESINAICKKLKVEGYAYNAGTPEDFYTAAGMPTTGQAAQIQQEIQTGTPVAQTPQNQVAVQPQTVQTPAPTYLRSLGLSSDTIAQWLEVKQYSVYGKKSRELGERQFNEVETLTGLYGIAEAMSARTEAMTDRQKVEWAAARIAETTGYAWEIYNKHQKGDYSENTFEEMLQGRAVCEGYADLFALYIQHCLNVRQDKGLPRVPYYRALFSLSREK